MAQLRALLAVLAVLAAPGAARAARMQGGGNVCVVPVTLSSDSQVAVGGKITQPLEGTVIPTNKAPFSGQLAVVFPGGACPTAGNLKQALNGAFLSTPKSVGGVTIGRVSRR
jgi:hypothetical protein